MLINFVFIFHLNLIINSLIFSNIIFPPSLAAFVWTSLTSQYSSASIKHPQDPSFHAAQFSVTFEVFSAAVSAVISPISRSLRVLLDDLHPIVVVHTLPGFLFKNTTSVNLLTARYLRRAGLEFDRISAKTDHLKLK